VGPGRPSDPEAKGLVAQANVYLQASFLPRRRFDLDGGRQRPARRLAGGTNLRDVSVGSVANDWCCADAAAASPDVELPAEAFARLVYGRLDAEHTPPGQHGPALDILRRLFPGP
jgi:hypothetical protein